MDFSSWARPACVAQVGGFQPPRHPLASWFGRVRVALPGEGWPTTDGAPMLALAQLNLRELPCRPPQALADVALVTLFFGPWRLPVDEPNGVNWALRAYPSLDGLVPLAEPTPARAGDPKLRKGQSLDLRPSRSAGASPGSATSPASPAAARTAGTSPGSPSSAAC